MKEKAIKHADFASEDGDKAKITKLEADINNGIYVFDEGDRHAVWSVFIHFLCSFQHPTVPKGIAKILKKSGTFS